jgi:hypothetical protein
MGELVRFTAGAARVMQREELRVAGGLYLA